MFEDYDADNLFDFPCEFPIKAMGVAGDEFEIAVLEIIRRHVDDLQEGAVKMRPSRTGKFVSITCTIKAESREQLDSIYRELSSHPLIKVAL